MSLKDTKFKKQMQRMHKQKEVMRKTQEIISKDKGEYQKDQNIEVTLVEREFKSKTYHQEILELVEQSRKKGWAYTNIGGVMSIGVYRDKFRYGLGQKMLESCNNGFPVYDLLSSLGMTISEPIFCKPFPLQVLSHIISTEVKIYLGIDYDMIVKFANDHGGSWRWSSSKELAKFRGSFSLSSREIFSFNNKGIIIHEESEKKIFFRQWFWSEITF